ncbi:hypothetical protein [Bacillus salipaludis]|uniref:Uncharacterized protein n=1 Tax=Bacillus salipaludis TaxID=2547811 RepID=A0ABW8RLB8_9BACI
MKLKAGHVRINQLTFTTLLESIMVVERIASISKMVVERITSIKAAIPMVERIASIKAAIPHAVRIPSVKTTISHTATKELSFHFLYLLLKLVQK